MASGEKYCLRRKDQTIRQPHADEKSFRDSDGVSGLLIISGNVASVAKAGIEPDRIEMRAFYRGDEIEGSLPDVPARMAAMNAARQSARTPLWRLCGVKPPDKA